MSILSSTIGIETITQDEHMLEVVRRNWGLFLLTGIVLIALGIGALFAPVLSTVSLTLAVGAFMVARGIIQLIHAVQIRKEPGTGMRFAQAFLALVVGAAILMFPVGGMFGIAFALAFYFFANGALTWTVASALPLANARFWGRLSSVASFVLGVYIIFTFPFSAFWVPGTLLGIDLIFGGTGLIGVAMSGRKVNEQPSPSAFSLQH